MDLEPNLPGCDHLDAGHLAVAVVPSGINAASFGMTIARSATSSQRGCSRLRASRAARPWVWSERPMPRRSPSTTSWRARRVFLGGRRPANVIEELGPCLGPHPDVEVVYVAEQLREGEVEHRQLAGAGAHNGHPPLGIRRHLHGDRAVQHGGPPDRLGGLEELGFPRRRPDGPVEELEVSRCSNR